MIKSGTIKGLLIQYFLFALLAIFSVTAVSMNTVSKYLKSELTDKGKKIIEVLTNSVNASLQHPLSDLYSIKEIIEDDAIEADAGHIMENFVKNRDYFVIIQLIDYRGRVKAIAPYSEEFMGIDVSRQEYFKNTLKSDKPYWSSTLLSAQLDRPFVSLSLKTTKGILTAFLLPESMLKSIQELVNLSKSYITVTDRHGVFIVHPDEDNVQQRVNDPSFNKLKDSYRGGIYETAEMINGKEMIVYVEFIGQLGWMIKVHQSLDTVVMPIKKIIIYLAILALIVTLVFSLFTAKQLVKVGKSLESIVDGTVLVAGGNYDIALLETDFKDLNSLIHSFNHMAGALSQRETELKSLNRALQVQVDRITHAEQTFKTLIEGTTGKYGHNFLNNLTKEIAGWFGVDTVMVTLFDYVSGIASAVSMYSDGKYIDGYNYQINGSPCETVANGGFQFYDKDIAKLFPEDTDLEKGGAEAYFGTPLINEDGDVKGVICAVSSKTMTLPEWGKDLLEIVASKAVAELERMDAEEKIKQSLAEKEVMLKEIHHRVKNNMQIVIGLLSLQMEGSDPKVVQQLTESINRIYVMALLHQKLYQTSDLSKVEVSGYVKSLLENIISTSNISREVSLRLDIDEVPFNIEQIIPVGLIINELVTNALKHAYRNSEAPELSVSLKDLADRIVITIEDNGVGFPADFDHTKSDTLGIQLVESLAMSLNGVLSIEPKENGACVQIVIHRI